jgi:nucleoside-diphosphate-sugar epimerase
MLDNVALVTGANGEIGHGLITCLGEQGGTNIIAIDLQPLDDSLKRYCSDCIQGDILDPVLLETIRQKYNLSNVFHLASILSTKAEHNPELAHHINVDGTLGLLKIASEQSERTGIPVKFIYPSSIAVYGMPSITEKNRGQKVKETEFCQPTTMYGCNKLYCEHLGRYYASYYRQLSHPEQPQVGIDFRCLRFPGLISAVTIPTGGTSDYGPEMLHHAAQNIPYACFVRPDSRLPFMVMPDAVKSIVLLNSAPRECLHQSVYNVTSFSPTAAEFYDYVISSFPTAQITFQPDLARQAIVDAWPADIEDAAARQDWCWSPDYDQAGAFANYLIPAIRQRYSLVAS